jgi:hypothetical protein
MIGLFYFSVSYSTVVDEVVVQFGTDGTSKGTKATIQQ